MLLLEYRHVYMINVERLCFDTVHATLLHTTDGKTNWLMDMLVCFLKSYRLVIDK